MHVFGTTNTSVLVIIFPSIGREDIKKSCRDTRYFCSTKITVCVNAPKEFSNIGDHHLQSVKVCGTPSGPNKKKPKLKK